MISGFFGENFCKFGEFLGEDNWGFCLFCSSSKFYSSGKSGNHQESQDKVEVSSNDPMESSVSFGLGNELVFCFMA